MQLAEDLEMRWLFVEGELTDRLGQKLALLSDRAVCRKSSDPVNLLQQPAKQVT